MTLPISVIIPCHNMEDTLYRAVVSAFEAGAGEVVIVDDGSRDPVALIYVMAAAGLYRFEKVIGVCGARNYGISKVRHDLIVPLDADDELLPEGLQNLRNEWQPHSFVYGGWYEGDTYISPPPPEMLTRKNIAHATWLFHRDDWQRVGGYDPDFNIGGEDYAFMVALVNAGVKPVRVDVPIYRKHIRAGSRTDAARARYPFIQQLLREKYPTFFAV